jgi:hypothetical protein
MHSMDEMGIGRQGKQMISSGYPVDIKAKRKAVDYVWNGIERRKEKASTGYRQKVTEICQPCQWLRVSGPVRQDDGEMAQNRADKRYWAMEV